MQQNETVGENFPIIALGASAGGLEALQQFFANVDPDFEAAYVVIQHLSPDYESKMDELLARKVSLPIRKASDGCAVHPGTIYLMPAGAEMIFSAGKLRLLKVDGSDRLSLPIDSFFRSLAQEAGRRATAIVLSGTGSDGSRGAKEIHLAGGYVCVQSRNDAGFSGMPEAALATGVVDQEMLPGQMPDVLKHLYADGEPAADSASSSGPYSEPMKQVLALLEKRYALDFSQYNPGMILRRVERRLRLENQSSLPEYLNYLEGDPQRVAQLYHDLMIGVSSFFRDREAFDALLEQAIRPLVKSAADDGELRVWVEGCSTGQEAYSLTILFLEELRRTGKSSALKVFATDADHASLEFASRGQYSQADLKAVDPALVAAYFEVNQDGFKVKEHLRAPVVFAHHNAFNSPPFTRMDLISCRNLIIYLKPTAKKKALSLFNFGLKKEGYLFLGLSETIAGQEDEFDVLDRRAKIFRKKGITRTQPTPTTLTASLEHKTAVHATGGNGMAPPPTQGQMMRTYDTLLNRFMPRSLLINEDKTLAHAFAGGEQFVRLPGGRISVKVPDCLIPPLRSPVAGLLRRVVQEGKAAEFTNFSFEYEGEKQVLSIVVEPFRQKRTSEGQFLILLEAPSPGASASGSAPVQAEPSDYAQEQIKFLENELSDSQENLQSVVEELEASNEELQATNEELVASNEELQSTNEELQSVNEELHTVNAEYQSKILELTQVTRDFENLLAASELGVVFLDSECRIRRFTPLVARLFNLVPSDEGRVLTDFKTALDYPELPEDLAEVRTAKGVIEKQVTDRHGDRYLLRLIPFYEKAELDGIIGTMINVTRLVEKEDELAKLALILSQSEDAIISLSLEGVVESWNQGAEALFGYAPEAAIGRPLADLIAPSDAEREEIIRYVARIQRGEKIEPFTAWRKTRSNERVNVSIRIAPILSSDGQLRGISAIDRDVTSLTLARDELRQREASTRVIFETLSEGVLSVDVAGTVAKSNRSCRRILGYAEECELVGRPVFDVLKGLGTRGVNRLNTAIENGHTLISETFEYERADGDKVSLELFMQPVISGNKVNGVVISILDNTARIQAEREREWLSNIVNSSDDLIGSCNARGETRFMNPGGLALCGLPSDADVVGLDMARYFTKASYRKLMQEALPTAEKAGSWHGETVLRCANGEEIPLSQSVIAHRGDDAKAYAFSYICRNMSERVEYETAIRASEDASRKITAKLSSVIESIPDLLFMVGVDLNLEFCSPTTHTFFDTIGGEKSILAALKERIRSVLSTGRPYRTSDYNGVIEVQVGKEVRCLLPRIHPNFEARPGNLSGATVLLQDVTEFRLLHDVKTNLLATVSHELKTPVTSIRMALELLLEDKAVAGEMHETLLSTASDETERLLRTLNTLLDLTRFEEGGVELNLEPKSPEEVVHETMTDFNNVIELRGLRVDYDIQPDLPEVDVDAKNIRHALGNFISNAIKHSPPEGLITVAVHREEHGSGIRFRVLDEGPGLPDEFRDRIFSKFFRLPGNKESGSGLGLSIAREFVLAHGGTIGCDNRPGGGADFFFVLNPKKEPDLEQSKQ